MSEMRRHPAGRVILFLLFVILLSGCAGELQRRDAPQSIADKERQEDKKEAAPPTFTYRP
jgi:Na+-transporting methylmalonyl-CoA/oxaloacetate decarboxylase gamma subunit